MQEGLGTKAWRPWRRREAFNGYGASRVGAKLAVFIHGIIRKSSTFGREMSQQHVQMRMLAVR